MSIYNCNTKVQNFIVLQKIFTENFMDYTYIL